MKVLIQKLALASSIALILGGVGTSFAAESNQQDMHLADARHESQILTGFSMNRHLRDFDITVRADGNKVVLGGTVENDIFKDLAGRIAADADGITLVENRIVVDPAYMSVSHKASDRSFGEKVDDATVTASVKSKLLWNSSTSGLNIHVDTDNGKVTLTGYAANNAEKERAGRIARNTGGVVDLNNQIAIGNEPGATRNVSSTDASTRQVMTDAWITSKVKSSLMLTRGVDSFAIVVTTTDGVVSLTGIVDSVAERELAMNVTRDIRGVKKVEASGLTVG